MKLRKKAHQSRAIAGVWVTVMLMLIIPLLGWAMDISYVAYVGQQLQVAADAASLGGAALAKTHLGDARAQAELTGEKNIAGVVAGVRQPVELDLNLGNLPEGDIVTGRFYRWDHPIEGHFAGDFVPTDVLGEVNAVKAVAWRGRDWDTGQLPLLFGPIFGVDTTTVTRDAIAMVGGATGAGLIVLCPDCECALDFSGTTELSLSNFPGYEGESIIQVDSNATGCSPRNGALCANGQSLTIDAPAINLVAEGPESYCLDGIDESQVPPLNPGQPYIPDPLRLLPEPDYNLMPDYGCVSSNGCYDTVVCSGGLTDTQGILCTSDADCLDDVGTCSGAASGCGGGPNTGNLCADDTNCEVPVSCDPVLFTCTDGPSNGAPCTVDTDCLNWTCLVGGATICSGGPNDGVQCSSDNECTDVGTCSNSARTACIGGTDEDIVCTSQADCPGGVCRTALDKCDLGDNDGGNCSTDADCPGGGSCIETVRIRPGYYSGGIRMTVTNFKLILEPGVYSLDDAPGGPASGLYINGGTFDARSGVLLHVVNDGIVDLAGGATVLINPSTTPGDIYDGISIFQSRTNYNDARIIGNNTMVLAGTYYFPRNKLSVGGTGIALGNQLIAWEMDMHGTGEYSILYDGRNPAPGYKVWLVE